MSKYPIIPGYRIEDKLGEGGMATVYLGIQEKLNRKVAIKILEPSFLKNPSIRERFLIEAETAASISHTHIVSIYDIGHVDQFQYIVMEYLKETLKDHMYGYANFKVKPEAALKILKPISEALDHAHSKGIIHRDIKTENIMFREDNTPVLVDFGIARVLDSNSQMTRTGLSLGTPYYMSPEQCQAEKLDGRSDFYSLGVVFFEIVTGEKPYMADNPTAVALQHIQDPIPPLPPELSRYQILINKMMAKKREDRVANGAELRKIIDALLNGSMNTVASPTIKIPTPPEPKPSPTREKSTVKTMVDFRREPEEKKGEDNDQLELPLIESTPKPRAATKPVSIQKKYPIKTVAETIILIGLLLIIFMIFFSLGQGSKKTPPVVQKPQITNPVAGIKTNTTTTLTQSQWNENFQLAQTALESGDYAKAKILVEELKKSGTSTTPSLMELETRINNELGFTSYFDRAESFFNQKDYKKARENLQRAQEFKSTPALELLQKRIDTVLGKSSTPTKTSSKESPLMDPDNSAFNKAKNDNTVASYKQYMDEYPSGLHFDEALAKKTKIEEDIRQKNEATTKATIKRIPLRSQFNTLNFEMAQTMITHNGFFDNEFNKNGDCKNNYENKTSPSGSLVLDHTTGLMWYGGATTKAMSYKKADSWVRDLNSQQYGGYANWRLPTLEEAATLLEKRTNADGLHIAPAFRLPPQNIWTGDTQRPQTLWVVRFDSGTIYADSDRSAFQVLAVRSME